MLSLNQDNSGEQWAKVHSVSTFLIAGVFGFASAKEILPPHPSSSPFTIKKLKRMRSKYFFTVLFYCTKT